MNRAHRTTWVVPWWLWPFWLGVKAVAVSVVAVWWLFVLLIRLSVLALVYLGRELAKAPGVVRTWRGER